MIVVRIIIVIFATNHFQQLEDYNGTQKFFMEISNSQRNSDPIGVIHTEFLPSFKTQDSNKSFIRTRDITEVCHF